MFWFLYAFILFWTALSISTVESVPNGATLAYIFHCLVAFGVASLFWVWAHKREPLSTPQQVLENQQFSILISATIFAQLIVLGIILVCFDGWSVLQGDVYRGAYRTQFGHWGFLLAALTKFCAPTLLAYGCFAYRKIKTPNLLSRALLTALFLLTLLTGMTLGAKTSGLQIASGGLLLIFWNRLNLKKLALLGIVGIAFAVFGAIQFDRVEGVGRAASYVVRRLTSVQGLPALTVWTYVSEDKPLPKYSPTLLSAFGSPVVTFLTGAKRPSLEYSRYDYSMLLTSLVYQPSEDVLRGEYNVTGTVFAEGLIAFGKHGFWIFSMIAGLIVGLNYFALRAFIQRDRSIRVALFTTYFTMVVLSWINSGSVTHLFHVVTIIGLALSALTLLAVESISRLTFATDAPAPARTSQQGAPNNSRKVVDF